MNPAEPLHPRTGEPTNAARAARVAPLVRAYAMATYQLDADRADLDTVLADFLTDVWHFAIERGVDREDVLAHACRMVDIERRAESDAVVHLGRLAGEGQALCYTARMAHTPDDAIVQRIDIGPDATTPTLDYEAHGGLALCGDCLRAWRAEQTED